MHAVMQTRQVKVTYEGPARSFKYVKNHHYIELEDADGHRIRLVARTLMKVECVNPECTSTLLIDWKPGAQESTLGVPAMCLHCGSSMEYSWGRGQLTFVPEGESAYQDPHTGDLLTVEAAAGPGAEVIPLSPALADKEEE